MPRIEQEPTESEGWQGGTRYDHPAYGQIGASRVSGARTLYGSDFVHQNYVSIHISRSGLERSLSRDWYSAGDELIRVDLSEAQWATFVSAMNMGSGVPCTLSRLGREGIPEIPYRAEAKQFKKEVRADIEASLSSLKKLRAKIEDAASGLSKQKKETLLGDLNVAVREIGENLPFVAEQFDEHIETMIEKAKVEVHGYMQNVIARAGIEALSASPRDILALEAPREDKA